MLTGNPSAALSILAIFPGPGVTVVALDPSDGPVPPPISVVVPLESAASHCCGEMKWMWVSMPPAVRIRCSPEIASVARPTSRPGVIPSIVCGLPALPIAQIRPSLMPTSALTTPSTASMIVTLVMTRSGAPAWRVTQLSIPMPSRMLLPPPKTTSSPGGPRRSRSISTKRFVSPSRIRSPVVGPYIPTYSARESWAIRRSRLVKGCQVLRGSKRNPRSLARATAFALLASACAPDVSPSTRLLKPYTLRFPR